ncbi:hypothetical protein LTR17_022531 [Elasticomyces elasticus]|nr:hypothetical protein LTR17_022531 [Elasticomyces elasticus]
MGRYRSLRRSDPFEPLFVAAAAAALVGATQARARTMVFTLFTFPANIFLQQLLVAERITATEFAAHRDVETKGNALSSEGDVTIAAPVTSGQLYATYKVLNIPELLEHILLNFSPAEQLRARSTCKGFMRALDGSPRSLRRTFRRVVTKSSRTAASFKINGLNVSLTQARGQACVSVRVGVVTLRRQRMFKAWKGMRKTLIAQPPPYQATLWADCAYGENIQQELSSSRGIRFGDMFDAISKETAMRAPLRSCTECYCDLYFRLTGKHCG